MAPRRDVIQNGGRATGIVCEGRGPVVLVVPDPHQPTISWFEPTMAGGLINDVTLAVVELAPAGEAAPDSRRFHPEAVTEDLREVLRWLDVDRVVAWGFAGGASFAASLARRRPDLVRGLIVGSASVGDPRGHYEGLELDREALIGRLVQALRANDWEAYFDAAPWHASAETRQEILAECRGSDIAAALEGELLRPSGLVLPASPSFVYWGDREPFHSLNTLAVESLPVQWTTVTGHRGDVMRAGRWLSREIREFLLETVSV